MITIISIISFGVEEVVFVYILAKISDRACRPGVLYLKLQKPLSLFPQAFGFSLFKYMGNVMFSLLMLCVQIIVGFTFSCFFTDLDVTSWKCYLDISKTVKHLQ